MCGFVVSLGDVDESHVKKATEILKKAKEQNTFKDKEDFYSNYYTSKM